MCEAPECTKYFLSRSEYLNVEVVDERVIERKRKRKTRTKVFRMKAQKEVKQLANKQESTYQFLIQLLLVVQKIAENCINDFSFVFPSQRITSMQRGNRD